MQIKKQNNMDVIIVSTRDYPLFYEKKDLWKRCCCKGVIDFISKLYEGQKIDPEKAARNFYIKEGRNVPFWIKIPKLCLLFRDYGDLRVYVMPCIPGFHIDGTVEGALKLEEKSRQDYIGTIIDDVLKHLEQDRNTNQGIFVLAHDLDITSVGRDEKMRGNYLVEGSKLSQYVNKEVVSLDRIYCFQHEPNKEMYKNILLLMEESLPEDYISTITNIIQKSAEQQAWLDDD